ncbi:hypothetical protein [Carp edema virus]|nr:hypothetical protein [Carp edema virus]
MSKITFNHIEFFMSNFSKSNLEFISVTRELLNSNFLTFEDLKTIGTKAKEYYNGLYETEEDENTKNKLAENLSNSIINYIWLNTISKIEK